MIFHPGTCAAAIAMHTWIRAHAWAASIAVVLLAHSDDNPDYARLGADAADEISTEASPA